MPEQPSLCSGLKEDFSQAPSALLGTWQALRESECCSTVSDSLWHHRLYSPWNSPGQTPGQINTGVGSLSLLQGTLRNPGIKPRSPALQADSLPAEPQGSINVTKILGKGGQDDLLVWSKWKGGRLVNRKRKGREREIRKDHSKPVLN